MPFLSPSKLAAALGISVSTFYAHLHGRLPVYKIGGRRCYDLEECLELLRAGRSSSHDASAGGPNFRHESTRASQRKSLTLAPRGFTPSTLSEQERAQRLRELAKTPGIKAGFLDRLFRLDAGAPEEAPGHVQRRQTAHQARLERLANGTPRVPSAQDSAQRRRELEKVPGVTAGFLDLLDRLANSGAPEVAGGHVQRRRTAHQARLERLANGTPPKK